MRMDSGLHDAGAVVWILVLAVLPLGALAQQTAGPIDLGRRRELFVDRFLIQEMQGGARLQLHHPIPREVAVVHDEPWEGNTCCYHTVFQDGDIYRMYYRGAHFPKNADQMKDDHPQLVCYAESPDGIHWEKPNLGLFEFNESRDNNIVWMGAGTHNFCPFKDSNPACPPEARYKALGSAHGGLVAFRSPDAINWELISDTPVITEGAFDSQNLAFWDPVRQCYVDYHRGFREGVRAIMTCTSENFLEWTEPVWLEYTEGTPKEHLYTNQITPYFRAPHIKMGFPKRFQPQRRFPGNQMPGISDGVFMTSRDGLLFHRWLEAFVRPGLQRERWVNRNNMTAWGIVRTQSTIAGKPDELSIYSTEGYYRGDSSAIRRFTLRLDGFVSVSAPMTGGEVITKTLTFDLPQPSERKPTKESPLLEGPLAYERQAPLRGKASLRVKEPTTFRIPTTRKLGESVTFAVTTQAIPPGHRRLFSSYNGGPLSEGTGEFIFDVFIGEPYTDDTVLRFMYNGVFVNVPRESLPDWESVQSEDAVCHFAATWDDGLASVYFNGRLVGEAGQKGLGAMDLPLGDVLFGEDYPPTSTSNEPFIGVADDILVLRRVLSAEDLATLAAEGAQGLQWQDDAGVLYTMEDERGPTLVDRLTGDGAADAALQSYIGPQPGECQLLINYSTSAAGSVRVELQHDDGSPIEGYALEDSDTIFGDHIERPVSWQMQTEVKELVDTPLRIRFELRDADIYSVRFGRAD